MLCERVCDRCADEEGCGRTDARVRVESVGELPFVLHVLITYVDYDDSINSSILSCNLCIGYEVNDLSCPTV